MKYPLTKGGHLYTVTCDVIEKHFLHSKTFNNIYKACLLESTKQLDFKFVNANLIFTVLFFSVLFMSSIILIISLFSLKVKNEIHQFNINKIDLIVIFFFINILISLVHTFDVHRYITIQAPLVFSMTAMGLFVIGKYLNYLIFKKRFY